MANRPLSDDELRKIVEDNEFWNNLENEDEVLNDEEDRLNAIEEIIDYGDASDGDETNVEEISDHDTDSEIEWKPDDQDYDSDDSEIKDIDKGNITKNEKTQLQVQDETEPLKRYHQTFYGKDQTKWSKIPPKRGKTVAKNIIILPGLKGPAKEKPPISFLDA